MANRHRQHDARWSPLRYDPGFCGPQKHRSCTDVICLFLFIAFIAGWGFLALFAFNNGDPYKLFKPVDLYGHRCGETDRADKPELFFFDITACINAESLWSGCKTPQICVQSCPSETWVAEKYLSGGAPFDRADIQKHLICIDSSIPSTVTNSDKLKDVIEKQACASWYIPSQPAYHRCIPNLGLNYTELADTYTRQNINVTFNNEVVKKSYEALMSIDEFKQFYQDVLNDLTNVWQYLVIFSLAALVISLFYIVLLRFISGFVVWASILALVVLFTTGIYYSYINYRFLKAHPTGRLVPESNTLEGKVNQLFNRWEFWALLLGVCSVFLLLILIIITFLRSRIYIATALIKEGSRAVCSSILSLFFPLVPWALQLSVLLYSVTVFLFLYSMGSNMYRIEGLDDSCNCTGAYQNIKNNDTCTYAEFNRFCHQKGEPTSHCYTAGCAINGLNSSNIVTYMQLYNLFGFFWGAWFISGLSQMILAGTFATWYWTFHKRNVPFFVLTRSIFRTMWYHMGTVAFGSLIVAICSFIRALIEIAEKKVKKYDNPITKAIFCCCKCFFWCLEKFLCFINRNAYIMCAIHGRNFCTSAKDAFELLMRNALRVIFVDKVTDFLFFLGKVLVTSVLVVMAGLVFTGPVRKLDDSGQDVTLAYPWVPMAIVGVMTYLIVTLFFTVYSVAVDTLFLCFLEDCERNDGSVEKPYFMSKQLMKILGKKNKKM